MLLWVIIHTVGVRVLDTPLLYSLYSFQGQDLKSEWCYDFEDVLSHTVLLLCLVMIILWFYQAGCITLCCYLYPCHKGERLPLIYLLSKESHRNYSILRRGIKYRSRTVGFIRNTESLKLTASVALLFLPGTCLTFSKGLNNIPYL